MSLEDLIVWLRIEEDDRLSEKKVGKNLEVSKANVVEKGSKPNKKGKCLASLERDSPKA